MKITRGIYKCEITEEEMLRIAIKNNMDLGKVHDIIRRNLTNQDAAVDKEFPDNLRKYEHFI